MDETTICSEYKTARTDLENRIQGTIKGAYGADYDAAALIDRINDIFLFDIILAHRADILRVDPCGVWLFDPGYGYGYRENVRHDGYMHLYSFHTEFPVTIPDTAIPAEKR